MTPGISPPMTLPLSTVSPSTVLPSVSPLSIPSAPSPVGPANSTSSPAVNQSSPVQIENLANTSVIVGQVGPPLKSVAPAAPSRKFKLVIMCFVKLIVNLF